MIWRAITNRNMIYYFTQRIYSTYINARIFTFIVNTSFVDDAITVYDTFRSTSNKWIPKEIFLAYAGKCFSFLSTISICSTLYSVTSFRSFILCWWQTLLKRISYKAMRTGTNWIMIHNLTNCIMPTRPWTWIQTFLAQARIVESAF